jgi:hypothetical protein
VSVIDWRVAVDVGADGIVGLVIEDPLTERPIGLDVNLGGTGIRLQLDYREAGELFDRLSQALGVVVAYHGSPVAGAAVLGLVAVEHDTPPEAADPEASEASGKVLPRGDA